MVVSGFGLLFTLLLAVLLPLTYASAQLEYTLRSDEDVNDRARWHDECRAKRLSADSAASRVYNTTYLRSRNVLKWHAFWVWARTDRLRTVKVRKEAFHSGLWLEHRFEQEFARPVRLCVEPGVYAEQMKRAGEVLQGKANEQDMAQLDATQAELPLSSDGSCTGIWVEEPFDWELFHPFVPVFAHWNDDYWNGPFKPMNSNNAATFMAAVLEPVIRKDVRYITMHNRGAGPVVLEWAAYSHLIDGMVILNQGGRGGHIPVPLLAEEHELEEEEVQGAPEPSCPLSFVGSIWSGARESTWRLTSKHPVWNASSILRTTNSSETGIWKEIMRSCALQLAPRGTNPSSFRLYEALQLGHIPVYVWDEVLWLPYVDFDAGSGAPGGISRCRTWISWQAWQGPAGAVPPECATLWHDIAVVIHISDYADWLDHPHGLQALLQDPSRRRAMKASVRHARDRYFTYAGVLQQVRRLIEEPRTAELKCVP